jgi:hypothetical protein
MPYRPGEPKRLQADAERAECLTGWRAATTLDEGLRLTFDGI